MSGGPSHRQVRRSQTGPPAARPRDVNDGDWWSPTRRPLPVNLQSKMVRLFFSESGSGFVHVLSVVRVPEIGELKLDLSDLMVIVVAERTGLLSDLLCEHRTLHRQ